MNGNLIKLCDVVASLFDIMLILLSDLFDVLFTLLCSNSYLLLLNNHYMVQIAELDTIYFMFVFASPSSNIVAKESHYIANAPPMEFLIYTLIICTLIRCVLDELFSLLCTRITHWLSKRATATNNQIMHNLFDDYNH